MILITHLILLLITHGNVQPKSIKQKPILINDWCTPDSACVIDGFESITYKSKHFVNDVHVK